MTTTGAALDSFTSFGALLKYLRLRARLNQTELAIAVGYSTAQISRLEQNQRLPDLTMLVALFVPALELGDAPETVARLLELAAGARGERLNGRSVRYTHTTRHETVTHAVEAIQPSHPWQPFPPGLPLPATPLVGRDSELAALKHLFHQTAVRLLTLIGPPGVGKSRLALALAAQVAPQFADGVLFVPLAAVADPALVPGTIAQELGLTVAEPTELLQQIMAHLRPRQVLLVLDNMEHLLAAAPLIVAVLAAAARVKVLLTSRTVLHVSGEHVWAVPPLPLPTLAPFPPLATLATNPAVALFVQRAVAAQPTFALSDAHALAIAAICVRLDGLPLAIELAAARVSLFAPPALLQRLAQRLPVLTGGARDVPSRNRTLRSAIAWSYDHLPPPEQRLFARLGVFVGGWTVAAAEAVCADDEAPFAIYNGLQSLLDHSLVQLAVIEGGERRFAVLETLREYALEQLAARGEVDQLRARHAAYWLGWIEEAEAQLDQPLPEVCLVQFAREHDNLRAALAWNEHHAPPDDGLRLAGALGRFWYAHGWLHEGRDWLARMLARRPADQDAAARAKALNGAANLAWRQGAYDAAEALSDEALACASRANALLQMARASNTLGIVASAHGDYALATMHYYEALTVWRAANSAAGTAKALHSLGNVAINQGDYARAIALHEESLAISRAGQDTPSVALTLNNLGVSHMVCGEYAQAEALFEESLTLHRALHDRIGMNYAINNLGGLAIRTHRYAQASAWLDESIELAFALGDQLGVAINCEGLAEILSAQPLTRMGAEQAACLCGAAAALHLALRAPLDAEDQTVFDRSVATTRAALGEAAFIAAWGQGQALPLEQVVHYARAVAHEIPSNSKEVRSSATANAPIDIG